MFRAAYRLRGTEIKSENHMRVAKTHGTARTNSVACSLFKMSLLSNKATTIRNGTPISRRIWSGSKLVRPSYSKAQVG